MKPKEGEDRYIFLQVRFSFSLDPDSAFLTLILIQFYRSLMEWTPDLYLVSLLEEYLFPVPQITGFVQEQLTTIDQKDDMTVALRQVMKLWRTIETPYDALLNHTCLDWRDELLVAEVLPDLRLAMFTHMLGDKTRKFLLDRYSDVHLVRSYLEAFIMAYADELEDRPHQQDLWWDGVSPNAVAHAPWLSGHLRGDKDFYALLQAWNEDNRHLQDWLEGYERTTVLANNWEKEESRVFSEEVAVEVMKFGEVRPSGMPLR